MILIALDLRQKHLQGGSRIRHRLVGTLEVLVAVKLIRRPQRPLFHAMKDVLDVDQVTVFEPKINAHPQEFLSKHGNVKSVAVETRQVASVKPLEQSRRNASEGGCICNVCIVYPVNQT